MLFQDPRVSVNFVFTKDRKSHIRGPDLRLEDYRSLHDLLLLCFGVRHEYTAGIMLFGGALLRVEGEGLMRYLGKLELGGSIHLDSACFEKLLVGESWIRREFVL